MKAIKLTCARDRRPVFIVTGNIWSVKPSTAGITTIISISSAMEQVEETPEYVIAQIEKSQEGDDVRNADRQE